MSCLAKGAFRFFKSLRRPVDSQQQVAVSCRVYPRVLLSYVYVNQLKTTRKHRTRSRNIYSRFFRRIAVTNTP